MAGKSLEAEIRLTPFYSAASKRGLNCNRSTAASTIHLGREVEIAFQNELIKAETWGKNDAKASTSSSMDIHLLQSLCKSICKKDGRDALLEYVIQAIEDVELVDTNNYSDDEVQNNSDDGGYQDGDENE